ncbi:hypothetical protein JCM8547_005072 [Rhodosporidiobolus lusitaniae]
MSPSPSFLLLPLWERPPSSPPSPSTSPTSSSLSSLSSSSSLPPKPEAELVRLAPTKFTYFPSCCSSGTVEQEKKEEQEEEGDKVPEEFLLPLNVRIERDSTRWAPLPRHCTAKEPEVLPPLFFPSSSFPSSFSSSRAPPPSYEDVSPGRGLTPRNARGAGGRERKERELEREDWRVLREKRREEERVEGREEEEGTGEGDGGWARMKRLRLRRAVVVVEEEEEEDWFPPPLSSFPPPFFAPPHEHALSSSSTRPRYALAPLPVTYPSLSSTSTSSRPPSSALREKNRNLPSLLPCPSSLLTEEKEKEHRRRVKNRKRAEVRRKKGSEVGR